jgi:SAM-dependent methyltransferase
MRIMDDIGAYISNEAVFDEEKGTWDLTGGEGLKYRDNLLSEPYQRKVLKRARDLSSDSEELQESIVDLVTEYNFSNKRASILRGFDFNPDASVLEVGCGCGAITRFLGETFGEVFSVEGSPTRAQIAALRTRDLDGVTILSAPFHKLDFRKKFDLVVCIGVLEYSPMYIEAEYPVHKALSMFRDLLTDDGTLIIAIENQFGLKYFAGYSEDHTGIRYDGIEGYPAYGVTHPMTFGRQELAMAIGRAGFGSASFWYPFPDYKFPECLISDRLFDRDIRINVGELIGQYRSVDYLRRYSGELDEKLAWWELGRNGLVRDLANSFLVFANNSVDSVHAAAQWDIKMFNLKRSKRFCSHTSFVWRDGDLVGEKVFPYYGEHARDGKLELRREAIPWVDGSTLGFTVDKEMASRFFGTERFAELLAPWANFLAGSGPVAGDTMVSGEYLDAMPWNLIPAGGGFEFLDKELCWKEDISLNTCVTRGIYYLVERNIDKPGYLWNFRFRSVRSIVCDVCASVLGSYGRRDLEEFIRFEAELGCEVSGKPKGVLRQNIRMRMRKRVFPFRSLARNFSDSFYRYFLHLRSAIGMLILAPLMKFVKRK